MTISYEIKRSPQSIEVYRRLNGFTGFFYRNNIFKDSYRIITFDLTRKSLILHSFGIFSKQTIIEIQNSEIEKIVSFSDIGSSSGQYGGMLHIFGVKIYTKNSEFVIEHLCYDYNQAEELKEQILKLIKENL